MVKVRNKIILFFLFIVLCIVLSDNTYASFTKVHGYDSSGIPLWKTSLFDTKINAYSPIEVVGDRYMFLFGDNTVTQFDLLGNARWQFIGGDWYHSWYHLYDSGGNIYISEEDFGDGCFVKMGPRGQIVWKKNLMSHVGGMCIDDQDYLYVERFVRFSKWWDIKLYLLKFSKDGKRLWERFIIEGDCRNFYLSGPYCGKNQDIYYYGEYSNDDPGTSDTETAFLIKLNGKGEEVWRVEGEEYYYSLYQIGEDGDLYAESAGKIAKIDNEGDILWQNEDYYFKDDLPFSLIRLFVLDNGHVAVCGQLDKEVALWSNPNNVVLFVLDEQGNMLWNQEYHYRAGEVNPYAFEVDNRHILTFVGERRVGYADSGFDYDLLVIQRHIAGTPFGSFAIPWGQVPDQVEGFPVAADLDEEGNIYVAERKFSDEDDDACGCGC